MIKRYKNRLYILLYVLSYFSITSSAMGIDEEIDRISLRFYDFNFEEAKVEEVGSYLSSMQADGSFDDINYQSQDVVYWEPRYHLERLTAMAYAYTKEESLLKGDESLFNKIVLGLQYWYDLNLVSPNSWFEIIAVPQRYGTLFIALREYLYDLPQDLRDNIIERWWNRGGDPDDQAGGINKSDVALQRLYYGLVTDAAPIVDEAVYNIRITIHHVKNKEGFQYDNSYFTHGNQLYIGGYGENHLLLLTKIAVCLKGTKYAFTNEEITVLSEFVRNTFIPCIRGGSLQWNSYGRGIARKDDLSKKERLCPIMQRMAVIDETYGDQYLSSLMRIKGEKEAEFQVKPLSNWYWLADFYLHVRPGFTFSVRANSVNTIKPEHGNGENLLGYYLGEGSTCLTMDGSEYYNIMPLWDWAKIPGTTVSQLDYIPSYDPWGANGLGVSRFCGGVTDSVSGIATFFYEDTIDGEPQSAKKSWFMFDDAVACIGNSLSSLRDMTTTIEQNWGGQNVKLLKENGQEEKEYRDEFKDLVINDSSLTVLHNGVGYYFPDSAQLKISNCCQNGSWHIINSALPDTVVTGKVFTLSLNTRKDSQNKNYAYVIYPQLDDMKTVQYNVDIIANTDSVQVVYHKSSDKYGIVFFSPCTFSSDSFSITASDPCVILYSVRENSIYIADPEKKEKTILITLNYGGGNYFTSANFHPDYFAGRTVRCLLSQSTGINNDNSIWPIWEKTSNGIQLLFNQPFNGYFQIYGLDGKLIKSDYLEGKIIHNEILAKGVYVLKLISFNKCHSYKLCVQ